MDKLWIFAALLIVLVLIGAAAWLVRKFSSGNAGAGANRGRMPRLAVIDATAVDNRRKLVLVRRDNVEHLIMIGGPTDVVVEPNIQRNAPQRDQVARAPAGTELPGRIAPLPDANEWHEPAALEYREPAMPEPPPRPRAPYPEDTRRASPPIADFDTAPSFQEPIRETRTPPRAEPAMPRMPRANDIAPKPAAPPPRPARQPEPLPSSADQNLADMAQRLEAALRRPGSELRLDGGETRAPAVNAADRVGAPPPPARSAQRAAPAPAAKPGFDNLEDEMASLLGRPKPPA
ncbi:MAG: FliO/MopB family protein [Rhizobiales bacterium]|nr:FliO/MopB family protein [Hyphomicrobiales bacterium]